MTNLKDFTIEEYGTHVHNVYLVHRPNGTDACPRALFIDVQNGINCEDLLNVIRYHTCGWTGEQA